MCAAEYTAPNPAAMAMTSNNLLLVLFIQETIHHSFGSSEVQ
jgi:hypothetical protein